MRNDFYYVNKYWGRLFLVIFARRRGFIDRLPAYMPGSLELSIEALFLSLLDVSSLKTKSSIHLYYWIPRSSRGMT